MHVCVAGTVGTALIREVSSFQRCFLYTTLCSWDSRHCPHYRGVLISEVVCVCTHCYLSWTVVQLIGLCDVACTHGLIHHLHTYWKQTQLLRSSSVDTWLVCSGSSLAIIYC